MNMGKMYRQLIVRYLKPGMVAGVESHRVVESPHQEEGLEPMVKCGFCATDMPISQCWESRVQPDMWWCNNETECVKTWNRKIKEKAA